MSGASEWFFECNLLGCGLVYAHAAEKKPENGKLVLLNIACFLLFCAAINHYAAGGTLWAKAVSGCVAFLFLVHLFYTGSRAAMAASIYYTIWAFCTWQLMYEWCMIGRAAGGNFWTGRQHMLWVMDILVFAAGYLFVWLALGKVITDHGRKKIGPRQLSLAVVTFVIFQTMVLMPGNRKDGFQDQRWMIIYITQILLCVVLYLQNEMFVKSELRKELEIMGLLWEKEEEQYQLSKENIALLSQSVHDLKHQMHAIRSASQSELEQYLEEMEGRIRTYEAIVRTGCAALDTILTEKSLYCKDHGITISCMADGSQMGFLNTVDLYAILGNALDNAVEEVEKFPEKERRQIDVLIYRREQFLAIEITNPMEGGLVYEDGLPLTTKGSRRVHGFGLRSIRYMLKKYGGYFSIQADNGCITMLMMIPIPVY